VSTYAEVLAGFDDITRDEERHLFSVSQVDRFMNRALIETCEAARYRVESESISAVADQAVYAITEQGYDILRVEYDDEVIIPIGTAALRHADRNWAVRTGTPRYYYLDELYSSQEYLSVGLFETPSSNLTDGLTIWYDAHPDTATYTKTATEVDIPDWASGAVLFYMLYLAYTADTKAQSFEAAAVFKILYEDILERLTNSSRSRQPKSWMCGAASSPSVSVLNRLPQRIPAP